MGYRLVNLNESAFSIREMQEIDDLAKKRQLALIVQRALKEYFEKNNIGDPSTTEIKTLEDIDKLIEEYARARPETTNYIKSTMRESLLKKLREDKEITLNNRTGEITTS